MFNFIFQTIVLTKNINSVFNFTRKNNKKEIVNQQIYQIINTAVNLNIIKEIIKGKINIIKFTINKINLTSNIIIQFN